MSTPVFKIYTRDREYVAAIKYAEDAAAFAALLGDGTTIKYMHHSVLWTEGAETFSAADSYDRAAEVINERIRIMHSVAMAKLRVQAGEKQ